jgi:Baseplate J-like protein
VVFDRHAGSFTVYVYAITPVASASLLRDVQDVINEKAAFPITGLAVTPDLVGISLVTTIRLTNTSSSVDKELVAASARTAAEEYINNLGVGQSLVINEIADQIRNSDPRILDIGEPNKQLPEVIIWKSRADGTRYGRFTSQKAILM